MTWHSLSALLGTEAGQGLFWAAVILGWLAGALCVVALGWRRLTAGGVCSHEYRLMQYRLQDADRQVGALLLQNAQLVAGRVERLARRVDATAGRKGAA
jgi:hypothetical protein